MAAYKTDFEWTQECAYISNITDKCMHTPDGVQHRVMHGFNYDKEFLIRYCDMQRQCATRDGKHDSATFIQHCINDLRAAP